MREVAAGGVVYRAKEGGLQLLLIDDRYGKVSLSKGKQEQGETNEQTALREIHEETGITGRIRHHLITVHYQFLHLRKGMVNKEVHYFLVEAVSGDIIPQIEEISAASWYSPEEALDRQNQSGYENNDEVLRSAIKQLGLEMER